MIERGIMQGLKTRVDDSLIRPYAGTSSAEKISRKERRAGIVMKKIVARKDWEAMQVMLKAIDTTTANSRSGFDPESTDRSREHLSLEMVRARSLFLMTLMDWGVDGFLTASHSGPKHPCRLEVIKESYKLGEKPKFGKKSSGEEVIAAMELNVRPKQIQPDRQKNKPRNSMPRL